MLVGRHQMDVTANNLANASTPGYRSSDTIQRAFPSLLIQRLERMDSAGGVQRAYIGELGVGTTLDGTYTNFAPGALRQTDNPLDAALLEPDVFFTIAADDGLRYTRNGSFQLTAGGQLVDRSGNPVLGTQGPIYLRGNDVIIDQDGYLCRRRIGGQAVDYCLYRTTDAAAAGWAVFCSLAGSRCLCAGGVYSCPGAIGAIQCQHCE